MDAVIRFCFAVDPHELVPVELTWRQKIINALKGLPAPMRRKYSVEDYVTLYGQAEYCWDYVGLVAAKKAINEITG